MECLRDAFKAGVVLGGRYETVSPLNHGSFGMVFRAKDLQTNQMVAIKCLTKKGAAEDATCELSIDENSEELLLHSYLGSHPNIVNLLDSFDTEAHTYIVLEFCERGDLYEAIRVGHGPLETEHVRRFMTQLIDAVEYIHSKGIYHRDIKPENIFLTESGAMKLGDFGLATRETWTYENSVGSDRYMSPEQYDSAGAGYSPAQADIWAIGVCLLNVLFSRNPFTTPTESDPLFLDFSRDKQSLFDVFPSMSQDTFEVIAQCMSLDPRKRSLAGVRAALDRVISFTTDDEVLDDFCTVDRPVIASANREPLRTPSIQSPAVDNGAFPWAKALHATPKPIRQLSTIHDNESYTEDLFSKSGATATSGWLSGSVQTSSMSSVLDSSLDASMQALPLNFARLKLPTRKVSPTAGSLPIAMNKPRQSAMSWALAHREPVSKSWSDLWDEDEEEANQMEALKELNSRTWSHESKTEVNDNSAIDNDDTPRQGLSPAAKSASLHVEDDTPSIAAAISDDIDEDLISDGFFFHDAPPAKKQPLTPYSPPSNKRDHLDKWAALGEKRRAVAGNNHSSTPIKSYDVTTFKSENRVGHSSLFASKAGHGVSDFGGHFATPLKHSSPLPLGNAHNHSSPFNHHHTPNTKWTPHHNNKDLTKDRAKECPWSAQKPKAHNNRDWTWNFDWRREKRHGDVE
ncbi:Kinase-like protein [Coniochaeta hoffmannii]|uniref:Kinase-like protein n=1 Tax=Coniochaeta hoffmannii TaxID=91930 RepID=A0AA38VP58_9PEZI|nr:Kinase-like protein [Coniochaeta hoffmannii]